MGKSRLASEGAWIAAGLGATVLKGNCFETERALPYAPLIDLLRNFQADHPGEKLGPPIGTSISDSERLLHELAAGLSASAAAAVDPGQEKQRLFRGLADLLCGMADTLLLVVIEDLHWSDDSSLEYLLYLARRLRSRRSLLLLTYRSDEAGEALRHFLAEIDRQRVGTELALAALSVPDVDAMLRAIFELDRPIRAGFMDVLYPLTGGNPFYVEEILKSLLVAGKIYYAEGAWDRQPIEELDIPRTVQDALQRRAAQLSPSARELLPSAAVAGQRFEFSLLQALSAREESALLPLIKELVDAQLIVEESAERLAFRHALTREAIYSGLLVRERTALHQRIGETLELLTASGRGEGVASLAYHFHRAQVWQKALDYSLRAGQNARVLDASRSAVEHFTHAIEASDKLGVPVAPAVLGARGSAHAILGDFERARLDFEEAMRLSRRAGDERQECECLLDLGALWAGRDYAETGAYYEQAHRLARALNEPALLAHTLNRLGNWMVNVELPGEGLQYHHEALKLFHDLNDRPGLAETLDLLGMANYIRGDLPQSEYCYQQAVSVFRELQNRQGLASSPASMLLNHAHLQAGLAVLAPSDRFEALRACEEALKQAREIGWRAGEAYALIILGNFAAVKGEYAQAFQQLELSLAIAEEIEHGQWTVYARYCLGILYLDLLDLSGAREHLEAAIAQAKAIGSRWWVTNIAGYLASVYLAEQRSEPAAAVLAGALGVSSESLLPPDAQSEPRTMGQRRCWLACAEWLLRGGRPQEALSILERLTTACVNLPDDVVPALWLLRAEVLVVLKRVPEADASLLAAQVEAEAEAERPLLWRIFGLLAHVRHLQGRRLDSDEAAARARVIVHDLAVGIPTASARAQFLKRAEAVLPAVPRQTQRQRAKSDYGGLTAREVDVALLVGQGKTNREVSQALVLSERTVETHVAHVLGKLGFSTRAQIAAWVAERRGGGSADAGFDTAMRPR